MFSSHVTRSLGVAARGFVGDVIWCNSLVLTDEYLTAGAGPAKFHARPNLFPAKHLEQTSLGEYWEIVGAGVLKEKRGSVGATCVRVAGLIGVNV